jgi:hypothetical protein
VPRYTQLLLHYASVSVSTSNTGLNNRIVVAGDVGGDPPAVIAQPSANSMNYTDLQMPFIVPSPMERSSLSLAGQGNPDDAQASRSLCSRQVMAGYGI